MELTGTSLAGAKSLDTDSSGYYRFANLPPGIYTISGEGRRILRVEARRHRH